MKLNFTVLDPDKAYISNALWLPKKPFCANGVRAEAVKKALEFRVSTQNGQEDVVMWHESPYHIIVPREFLPPSQYSRYKFPFIDIRPKFEKVVFQDLVKPRNEEQVKAWEQGLFKNDNGILNLACGKGKTKLALKKIAQMGVPTLVIVPDGGILDQWKRSIYGDSTPGREQGPGLQFEGGLGLIAGSTFDWRHPVTLALVTSLWPKIEADEIPEEVYRHFGLIVYDEVHQIGAPKFALTASPWYGDRIGLTATVEREDGLDPIYRYHIGEPFYSDLSQELVPLVYFQQTPVYFDTEPAKVNGTTNVSILRGLLGTNYAANVFRYWEIQNALREGRKILALSHSKDQLDLFHAMFPGSGIINGDVETNDRLDILRNHQITFAIDRLGATGADDDRLDTLFWLTPFRSRVKLQQSMGRIQRIFANKKTPVMLVFEEWTVPTLLNMTRGLKTNLKKWGYGFETLRPENYPTTLPPEVQREYERVARGLHQRAVEEGARSAQRVRPQPGPRGRVRSRR